jgi:aubergine-like protein
VIVFFIILPEGLGLFQIDVTKHKLELWPGYLTSIRQHETDILMCCEITHKVMRQETILDLMTECLRHGEQNYRVGFYVSSSDGESC